ncbi:MAG TPA: PAS domain-containing protein [Geobacteraceae bacterium]|nr:PAS domain-containing protein [Geobacteraceae bacterium]
MPDARILIVEDEGIQALDMQRRLTALGYPVPDIASSGEEALRKATEARPDLVLMDIMLPGRIDGVAAAELIRSRFDAPVIYITAYADEDTLHRAKITEPYGYIVKPFKERELHIAIDMALYKSRIESKLKASERWLATTLKSIGDATVATDANGLITFMNAVAEGLMGWTSEEVLGKKLVDVFTIINRDTRRAVENPVTRVLREGAVVGLANHTLLISRSGKEIPIDDSAAPIKDGKGNMIGVVLVFRDITERDRVERERELTFEFLQLVNKSAGTADLVRSATFFFQEKSGCEAVGIRLRNGEDFPYFEARGFPREFVLAENQLCQRDAAGALVRDSGGNPLIECMCGNVICGRFDPAKPFFTTKGSFWTNSTTDLLAGTTEADRQGRTRNRCNGEGYESVALFPLCVGRERLGLLQFNDRRRGVFPADAISLWERMTDYLSIALSRFRAEEAALRAKEEWERTFKAIPDLIAILDNEHRVVKVNQAMADRLGLVPDQCIGAKCHEVVHKLPRPPAFCPHAMTCQDGEEHVVEVHEPNLGGDFLVSTSPLRDDNGQLIGSIHVARNITERKRMEEELLKKSMHLESANKELESFSYSVSHDLRAPLRGIDGYAMMLSKSIGDKLDEDAKRKLQIIRDQVGLMGQLIDGLLTFSRLGRAAMSPCRLDMGELAKQVWIDLCRINPGRRMELRNGSMPEVCGDRTLIRQVLSNLLSNAIKFTKARNAAIIEIGGSRQGDECQYYVKDNGIGFDMNYYKKLFGVFQRLHSEEEFEGTGVGLAIVQRIIHRHGGRVWGEGKVNEGAAFYFTLPGTYPQVPSSDRMTAP